MACSFPTYSQVKTSREGKVVIAPLLGLVGNDASELPTDREGFTPIGMRVQWYRTYSSSLIAEVLVRRQETQENVFRYGWVMMNVAFASTLLDRDVNGVTGIYMTTGLGFLTRHATFQSFNRTTVRESKNFLVVPIMLLFEFGLGRRVVLQISPTLNIAFERDFDNLWLPASGIFLGLGLLSK